MTLKAITTDMNSDHDKYGKVYLVGAGPGDPGLITLRAVELLKQADCIVCDKLANPHLLQYVKPQAEIINTPKRIGKASYTQPQINDLIIEKAKQGKSVVRLKGGDPCIFGRGGEEARLLADAGIEFEIVPGITAAVAAAEYAGILLTDRNYASQLAFVTGRESEDKTASAIDFAHLARFNGTIVLYMAMSNLDQITSQLIANGMAKTTPAAVIQNATTPSQRTLLSTVENLHADCLRENFTPPAIVIIGPAAAKDERLDWFTKKPLFGKTILTTRDQAGNSEFAKLILDHGAKPISCTAIKLRPLTSDRVFLQAVEQLSTFDWIIFTSRNGTKIFFDFLKTLRQDARVFARAKIAAIGSATADALAAHGITADFTPDKFTSEQLGLQLTNAVNLKNKKILLLRSDLATKTLSEILIASLAVVTEIPLYTVESDPDALKNLDHLLTTEKIDWITFASPSAVRAFFEQIDKNRVNSTSIRVASIGPVTTDQLADLGVKIDLEAAEHTLKGLLNTIEKVYK